MRTHTDAARPARSFNTDAKLAHVRVFDSRRTAFWLRGSAACEFRDCEVQRADLWGFFCDAMQRCVFERCSAEGCQVGAEFDLPATLLRNYGFACPPRALLQNAHSVQVRLLAWRAVPHAVPPCRVRAS